MLTANVDGITTTYGYDGAGQLASEVRTGYDCAYTYDANGNRLTKTLNGTTETYTNDDGDKGGWPNLLNVSNNAMTVNGTVHLQDLEDYEEYVNSIEWSRHERVHIAQELEYHDGDAVYFVATTILQYIFALGHDGSPYEIKADAGTLRRRPATPSGVYTLLW